MHLLVVEDDTDTAAALSRDLVALDHSVVVARDGRDAIFYAGDQEFDAIVLDRMLPLADGIHVVKRLRSGANVVPILMLSALGDLVHRLEGLEAGVDDYLVKPADSAEINARLHAILRRSRNEVASQVVHLGEVEVDMLNQTVKRDGAILRLKPTEFRILRELVGNIGQVVTRTMLLETVWGYHFEPESNIVEMHIHRLRAQLRSIGADNIISTVRRSGYVIRDL
ncbi:response regulator transcription factor [Sphingomonas nostoxanthinifaciens]|uniref:response regulator transcription factor n=1 Tax=Sphingomonas nostoxanthinifaciens TaxID=2872652 RepID=UPI001CC2155E|nr:response regulator transcription factor [Sphingomonas nostoxanthinifaciens]UAK25799.1 response regulator transcription factor [Sphingomonas nostoxanthinifaciens]